MYSLSCLLEYNNEKLGPFGEIILITFNGESMKQFRENVDR